MKEIISQILIRQYQYNKEKLQEFKKELESKAGSLEKAGHEEEGGFGGFGGSTAKKSVANTSANDAASAVNDSNLKNLKLEGFKPLWHNKDMMSPLMQKKAQAEEIRLIKEKTNSISKIQNFYKFHLFRLVFEQQQLLKRINEKVSLFNAELNILRHEKGMVSILNKNIDLR